MTIVINTRTVLAARPADAKIAAELLDDFIGICDDLNAMLWALKFNGLQLEQVRALWCALPMDAVNMLDDFEARLGLPTDGMLAVRKSLFECFDDDTQADVLSQVFAARIRDALTPEQLVAVNAVNATRGSESCATHCYVDANEHMLDALNEFDVPFAPADMTQALLLDAAWTLARARGFAEVTLS